METIVKGPLYFYRHERPTEIFSLDCNSKLLRFPNGAISAVDKKSDYATFSRNRHAAYVCRRAVN